MSAMIVHMKVKDYGLWRKAFEDSTAQRRSGGFLDDQIFRSEQDGNDLILLMHVKDIAAAKQFAVSEGRRVAMERNGVIGTPTDYFVE
jgi:hypothetical protein